MAVTGRSPEQRSSEARYLLNQLWPRFQNKTVTVARELGISSSTVSAWWRGLAPTEASIEQLRELERRTRS
jgi:transcriptional regulator with XRE-family HTH domain